MEAINDLHSKEYLIQKLKHFRDDFQDKIPPEVIHSSSPDNKFKARRGWFQMVAGHLSYSLEDGHIKDLALKEKVDGFLKWCVEGEFKKGGGERLTSQEDIEKANEVINSVLNSLSPTSSTT